MTSPLDVWLWPEQEGIRAWTPYRTCLLHASSPGPQNLRLSDRHLRDGLEAIALGQALHPDIAEFLGDVLATGKPVQLRLARGLPETWMDFPYERLQYDGQSLTERIVVAREVPFPSDADTALSAAKAVALNLWPLAESIQPTAELRQRRPCLEIVPGRKLADRFMLSRNQHDYGLLIVVAHGSEGQHDAPFRLDDGKGWSLPSGRGMSALVILLACGSEDGNLLAYGRELLAAGARTVLAPRGKLDAKGAEEFLHGFLRDWLDQGLSVAEALRRAQIDDPQRYGAQRLYLLGEAGLRWGAMEAPEYATLDDLQIRARRELQETTPVTALSELCERLTLRHYQQYGALDEVRLPVDESEEARLLQRLYPMLDSLSPLTQSWVTPLLAYLAESHDHRLLPPLEERRRRLEQRMPEGLPPASHHHWAKLYYRQGHYALAARELVAGLSRLAPEQRLRQGVGLLGALMNLLIDQAMVEPARRIELALDLCLSTRNDDLAPRYRRNLVDRRARLALRAGDADQAHCLFRRRWQRDQGDTRVLNWLLYLSAWHPVAQAQEYLDKTLDGFDPAALNSDELVGNEGYLYRLRALAAWAWCHDDSSVADRIAPAIPFLTHRLLDHPDLDAGPPGFTLAYLSLYAHRQAPVWKDRLPPWGCIAEALREHRYFLELAAFAALRGETDEARRALETYQAQRRLIVLELRRLPSDLTPPDWDDVVIRREERERTGLLETLPITAEHLLAQGLLPL
ncbi:MAG: CHAT domain-containing protein [Methylococcaceae bacterium]|nr:CHAT domain-containing protein [Methylococcaceae bacterium]